ncbi:hypothetical protein ACFPM0_26470 [Pseudonocardia sulfidoxydans]|uniref:hypothetical protein n=1 Tax=Pseudonocardia sulfidoxydans TaxID=54011 RepID=UPI00361C6807
MRRGGLSGASRGPVGAHAQPRLSGSFLDAARLHRFSVHATEQPRRRPARSPTGRSRGSTAANGSHPRPRDVRTDRCPRVRRPKRGPGTRPIRHPPRGRRPSEAPHRTVVGEAVAPGGDGRKRPRPRPPAGIGAFQSPRRASSGAISGSRPRKAR